MDHIVYIKSEKSESEELYNEANDEDLEIQYEDIEIDIKNNDPLAENQYENETEQNSLESNNSLCIEEESLNKEMTQLFGKEVLNYRRIDKKNRKRFLAKGEEPNPKWSVEAVRYLVLLYKHNVCLYDTKHPDYFNKFVRRKTMESVTRELRQKTKIPFSIEDVLCKMNGLRTQLATVEHMKIKKKQEGYSKEVKPSWWLYQPLQFLAPYLKTKTRNFKKYNVIDSSAKRSNETENNFTTESTQNVECDNGSEPNESISDPSENAPALNNSSYLLTSECQQTIASSPNKPALTDISIQASPIRARKYYSSSVSVTSTDDAPKMTQTTASDAAMNRAKRYKNIDAFCEFLATELNKLQDDRNVKNLCREISQIIWLAQDSE